MPSLDEVDKHLAETYLDHFVAQAWHVLEPNTPFRKGWHIDAICEHLTAVTAGQIKNLVINMPPRHMKSLSVSVFWMCWVWIREPHTRWLFASYAEKLSKRDSLKCRRLIQSPWYQERWGDKYRLAGDQNEKLRFENDKTGYRIATSVDGLGTGEGGRYIVVDDPHNVRDGDSDTKRQSTITWWAESMSTRGDDPHNTARVIDMQRVHEGDLSGYVLEQELGYDHLCLPARYEGHNRIVSSIGFVDPRTEEGQPLWPEMYEDETLTELEKSMTSYAAAAQLQQRPAPRGGGMFKGENFSIIKGFNEDLITSTVRYWDKAGTQGGGDYSAGVLMHKLANGRYVVADVVRGQWSAGRREAIIRQTAEMDGVGVKVWHEQEPGSGGKESAENTVISLAGFVVKTERVTGSKEVRAEPFAVQVENGNIDVQDAPWTKEYIAELEHFPTAKHDDQVDGSSGAFNKLSIREKKAGVWGLVTCPECGTHRIDILRGCHNCGWRRNRN